MGMSSEDIAHKFGNATVQIFMAWRAIDKDTGRPLYHKTVFVKGTALPCYVDIPGAGITRWLTSEERGPHQPPGWRRRLGQRLRHFRERLHHDQQARRCGLADFLPGLLGRGRQRLGLFKLNDKKARGELVDLSDSRTAARR